MGSEFRPEEVNEIIEEISILIDNKKFKEVIENFLSNPEENGISTAGIPDTVQEGATAEQLPGLVEVATDGTPRRRRGP